MRKLDKVNITFNSLPGIPLCSIPHVEYPRTTYESDKEKQRIMKKRIQEQVKNKWGTPAKAAVFKVLTGVNIPNSGLFVKPI